MAGCIQLCVLPVPLQRASTELFGLAPAGMLVSASGGQPPPSGFTVHAHAGSFLLQSRPSRVSGLRRTACAAERGLSSVSNTVSNPPAPASESAPTVAINPSQAPASLLGWLVRPLLRIVALLVAILPLLGLFRVTLLRISLWLSCVTLLPDGLGWRLLLLFVFVGPDVFHIVPVVVGPVIRVLAATARPERHRHHTG